MEWIQRMVKMKRLKMLRVHLNNRDPTMGGIKDGQPKSRPGASLSGMTVGGTMTHMDGTQSEGLMP